MTTASPNFALAAALLGASHLAVTTALRQRDEPAPAPTLRPFNPPLAPKRKRLIKGVR
jgi:hypothetical protein